MNISDDEKNIQSKISKLTSLIQKWNKEYYDLDSPSVSDQEYDQAFMELEMLEASYPELKEINSPTNRIGANFDSRFQKVTHKNPMLSLNKAYEFNDVLKYVNNINKTLNINNVDFVLEPKIDGLSIGLIYENGLLKQAVTRGNGLIGEDVTHNAIVIKNIPHKIDYLPYLEVRGEVYIGKKDFQLLNKKAIKENQKTFANPRNAASGSLRQLDFNVTKKRKLQAIIYQVVEPENHNIKTLVQSYQFLKNLGFFTQEWTYKTSDIDDLKEQIKNFKNIKNSFDYECDGLVIKDNEFSHYKILGKTAKFPHHSIAFKYDIEKAITKLIDIFPTVGRTGKITYNAKLEPVELNQTTVSAATLHNYDYIKNNKININDDVYVIKAGEIIPRVVAPVNPKHNSDFKPANVCPSCNFKLSYIDDNVDQYCLNDQCVEKTLRSLGHFCSRNAMNIVDLGERVISIFYDQGFIKKIQDIFCLEKHKNTIINLERFGLKSVENLLNSVEKSRKCYIHQPLYGLGIKHIGLQAAKTIAKHLNKLSDLFDFNEEKLYELKDVGIKSVTELRKFISKTNNVELIKFLDDHLIYKLPTKLTTNKFNNITFVITGTLSKSRDYFKEIIENNGGKVSTSVSVKTTFLLAGENAGSKLNKANDLKVKVLKETDFNKILEDK